MGMAAGRVGITSPTAGQGILKDFRGLLIVHGALGLLDRHLDATDLRVIQSLTVDEVSPIVHNGDHHRLLVLDGLFLSRGREFLRDSQAQGFLLHAL